MQNFANQLMNFVNSNRILITAVCCVALFAIGIMLIYPSERSKEKGKSALPWVIIGCALALSAVPLAESFGTAF